MAREATLYGLGVRSDREIAAFEHSPKPARIDVEWMFDRAPQGFERIDPDAWRDHGIGLAGDDEAPVRLRHARAERLFRFDYADGTRVALDDRGTRAWAMGPAGATVEDTATYLLGPVMGFVLRLRGIPCLHASAVSFAGRAIAFAGHACAGKSTVAATLALRGHRVLTEDVLPVRHEGNRFMACGGYPLIRLWPSSVRALFGSDDYLPRITPTWDKRYLALAAPRGTFEPGSLPLGAVFILEDRGGPETPVRVEPSGALVRLVEHGYSALLLDRAMRAAEFEHLARLVAHVPVFRVSPPDSIARLGSFLDVLLERLSAPEPQHA